MRACAICGNTERNRDFLAREMMFGFRDTFPYFECSACGCLQIAEIPYFVNGLGGMSHYNFKKPVPESQARYNADYGALLVTASDADLAYDFVSCRGKVIDSYTQSHFPSPAATRLQATPTPTGKSTSTAPSHHQ